MTQDHNPPTSNTFVPAYRRPYAKTTTLSDRDRERFEETLEEEEPNENLKEAARAHNEMLSSSDKL